MMNQVIDDMQSAYRDMLQSGRVADTSPMEGENGAVGGMHTPSNPVSVRLPETQIGERRRGIYVPDVDGSFVETDVKQADTRYGPVVRKGSTPILGRGIQSDRLHDMNPDNPEHVYAEMRHNQRYNNVPQTDYASIGVHDQSGGVEPRLTQRRSYDPQSMICGGNTVYQKPLVMPDKYDGSVVWQDYLTHFSLCAELNIWDERQMATYLAVSLRGPAQQLLGDMTVDRRRNYRTLVEALAARFGYEGQTELFRVQLKSRLKKAGESYPELAQAITRLVARAYPQAPYHLQQTLSKEHFIDALIDSDMRLRIQQNKPFTLEEAVRNAIELEAFQEAEKQRLKQGNRRPVHITATESLVTNIDGGENLTAVLGKLRGQVNDLTLAMKQMQTQLHQDSKQSYFKGGGSRDKKNRRRQNMDRSCWGCGEIGHYLDQCPKGSEPEVSEN